MHKTLSSLSWKNLLHLCISIELIIAILYIFLAHEMMSSVAAWYIPTFWIFLAFISLCFIASVIINPSNLNDFIRFHQVFHLILSMLLLYTIQPETMAVPQLLPEDLQSESLLISFILARIFLLIVVLLCKRNLREDFEKKTGRISDRNCS